MCKTEERQLLIKSLSRSHSGIINSVKLVVCIGDAWALSRSHDGIIYLQHESEIPNEPLANLTKGFDFSASPQTPSTSLFTSFTPPPQQGKVGMLEQKLRHKQKMYMDGPPELSYPLS